MKEENEMKKAFLERFWTSKKIQESIWDEIRELRSAVMLPGINTDGMPHGTGSSDLSSYAIQLDRLEKKLSREIGRQIRIRNQIWKAIEGLPTESEKMVLKFRYINRYSWEEAAVKSCYTYRHTLRIHGEALEHLEVPDWFRGKWEKNKRCHSMSH